MLRTIGSFTVSNGEVYDIVHQVTKNKYIVMHTKPDGNPAMELSHSNHIDACWRAIRFASRIGQTSEHSPHVQWAPKER